MVGLQRAECRRWEITSIVPLSEPSSTIIASLGRERHDVRCYPLLSCQKTILYDSDLQIIESSSRAPPSEIDLTRASQLGLDHGWVDAHLDPLHVVRG